MTVISDARSGREPYRVEMLGEFLLILVLSTSKLRACLIMTIMKYFKN